MRFIHTGDIHWGMSPDCDRPWSRERAQAIKETFEEVIRQARERDVDFLFIAGDLFHRQPLARDLKEVNYLFSTIPSVHVVLIAGNHDRIRKNSALMSFKWCSNVTFLMSGELESAVFGDCDVEVYGFSYYTPEILEARLDETGVEPNGRIQILLAHGGDSSHVPIDKDKLALSPFAYIALGHIHKPQILLDRRAAYCGSLEPLDKTETGPHGILVGEISPATRQVTTLEFVPMCQSQYISLAINVTRRPPTASWPTGSPRRSRAGALSISIASLSGGCGTRISFLTLMCWNPGSRSPRSRMIRSLNTTLPGCSQSTRGI